MECNFNDFWIGVLICFFLFLLCCFKLDWIKIFFDMIFMYGCVFMLFNFFYWDWSCKKMYGICIDMYVWIKNDSINYNFSLYVSFKLFIW